VSGGKFDADTDPGSTQPAGGIFSIKKSTDTGTSSAVALALLVLICGAFVISLFISKKWPKSLELKEGFFPCFNVLSLKIVAQLSSPEFQRVTC
jgi:hypothetical protein